MSEDRDSVRDRVWAAAPTLPANFDVTTDVRAMRDEDAALSDAAAAAVSVRPVHDEAGEALLAHLGLR